MVTNIKSATPFGAAFEANADLIRAAVEHAAAESASKMGDAAAKLFSIEGWGLEQPMKLAA